MKGDNILDHEKITNELDDVLADYYTTKTLSALIFGFSFLSLQEKGNFLSMNLVDKLVLSTLYGFGPTLGLFLLIYLSVRAVNLGPLNRDQADFVMGLVVASSIGMGWIFALLYFI